MVPKKYKIHPQKKSAPNTWIFNSKLVMNDSFASSHDYSNKNNQNILLFSYLGRKLELNHQKMNYQ